MAEPRARIGGGGYDLRQRGFSAMAVGSEHHSVHAHQGQHSPQEKPVLWSRAFYLSARTQSLHLSRWPPINYGGRVYRNRAFAYIGTRKRCGACSLRAQCTSAPFRSLIIHQNEAARQRTRDLANTPEFAHATATKKEGGSPICRTEELHRFASLVPARLKFVREQFYLAAAGQNLKRLVRFLSTPRRAVLPVTLRRLKEEKLGRVRSQRKR